MYDTQRLRLCCRCGIIKIEFDMRHRPKRENYPIGTYGDMDYQERLERYCTYLENRNKALTEQCNIADDVRQSEQYCECEAPLIRTGTCGDNQEYCGICELDIK